jgi:hypothetical protein
MKISKALWKAECRVLELLKIELPYDLMKPLLDIHPKEIESAKLVFTLPSL